MKIVYIEDNNLDFMVFERLFQGETGFEIIHYDYLIDFLNAEHDFDVVIADLSLPDAYGPEVLKKIHEVTDKPIIALSGVGGAAPPLRLRKAIEALGVIYFASKNKYDLAQVKKIILALQ